MSGIGCNCADKELSLVGRPNCVFNIKATRRVAIMHARKSDGTRNFIDVTAGAAAGFSQAWWNSLLTNPNPQERLYLSADLENTDYPPSEATKEEAASGRSVETRPEFLGFQGENWDKDANSVASLEYDKLKCNDFVYFPIDVAGSIFGDASEWEDGKLYGIAIMGGSFSKQRMLATDGATNKIMISWQNDYARFRDGNLGGISSSLMDVTPMSLSPVQRVNGVATLPTTTEVVLTVTGNFIEGIGYNSIVGLVAADFTLEDSTGTPVTITGVVESPDGTYTITATMPAGDYTVGLDVEGHIMAPVTFTTA